jgi:D-alanyl-D-alanine carboxypeptidase/D-alanyl-D-alanine-endopeptidase (penicillin-binding protein 4)
MMAPVCRGWISSRRKSAARLLAAMAKSATSNVFRDSLPIAGRDGTLSGRLASVSGRILAKTGTLTYDHSLSGYALTAGGEVPDLLNSVQ